MRTLFVIIVALCVVDLVWSQLPCPGKCESEWRPVCGLSVKRGNVKQTFSNVCTMNDWNRCYKADYQVSKFSVC